MSWQSVALAGIGGLGVGAGLVLGMFTVRWLRRFLREEDGH